MMDNYKHNIATHLRYFPIQDRIFSERYAIEGIPSSQDDKFSEVLSSIKEEESEEYTKLKSVASIIGLEKMVDDLESCPCYNMDTASTFIKKIISLTPTLLSGKYDLLPSAACARKGVIEELLLHYIPFKLEGISIYQDLHDSKSPLLELQEFHTLMRHAYHRLFLNSRRCISPDDIPEVIINDITTIIDYVRMMYDLFSIKDADPTDNVENLYMYLIYLMTSSAPIYVKAKELYKNRIVEPVELTDIFQNNPNQNFYRHYQMMEAGNRNPATDKIREFSDMIMDNTKKQFNFFGDNVFKSSNMDEIEKEFRYLSKDKISSFANIAEDDNVQFKLDSNIGMYLKEELNSPICEVQMVRDGSVNYEIPLVHTKPL